MVRYALIIILYTKDYMITIIQYNNISKNLRTSYEIYFYSLKDILKIIY